MRLADLEPYLVHFRSLPFVGSIHINDGAGPKEQDFTLLVTGPRGEKYRLVGELKRSNVGPSIISQIRHQPTPHGYTWILFAPYISRNLGAELTANGISYVDVVGNCRVELRRGSSVDHVAHIEGRKPEHVPQRLKGIRAPGYQVIFAILAKPELLNETIRTVAESAGVGKTAVAEMLVRLEEEGAIGGTKGHRRLLDPVGLMTRWIIGYKDVLRPTLLVGRYRTPDHDPETLEQRLQHVLRGSRWAWGGAAAAYRLTRHYRGAETVVHVDRLPEGLFRDVGALPSPDGPLTVLGVPGRIALEGVVVGTVHPLLAYAELLAEGDERSRETAQELGAKYLERLSR